MQQAKKILIGAETYPPDVNGAAQFGHRLATSMLKRGHEVHVVAANPSRGPSYRTVVEGGIVEHRLRSHLPPTHETNRICIPWESTPRWVVSLMKLSRMLFMCSATTLSGAHY